MVKKRPYTSPEIKRLTPRHMGKHRVSDVALSSNWPDENVDYKDLMATFGSPLFLLSESKLRQQYRSFMAV